jgi:predicted nucleic acid-binding protein
VQVLISDTNIWIDLHFGGLLEATFSLPWQFVTTDFASAELIQPTTQGLVAMGLVVIPLSNKEIQHLDGLMATLRNSSVADVSCYLLAQQHPGWRLLSGDSNVRKSAQQAGLQCNGILWLLDELYRARAARRTELAQALRRMLARGAWLPADECQKRLTEWES